MKKLRSGYTTGACAAAAAKAAIIHLLKKKPVRQVDIPFPLGERVRFSIHRTALIDGQTAMASVIKYAGDDPDVTNGAEIVAEARMAQNDNGLDIIRITGGSGVGTVTKPGLPVRVGEPAINPVPRMMIGQAAQEAFAEADGLGGITDSGNIKITISVPDGERLAIHTLNSRLGITGGISILGTTGIVKPVSSEAWTATIKTSMDVAKAAGLSEVALSTGRTSEAVLERYLRLHEEAYVMMGDYLEFSLKEAASHGFERVHIGAMWAKLVKAAMGVSQTHVRHGALEIARMIPFLKALGLEDTGVLDGANTARQIYGQLVDMGRVDVIRLVCARAKAFCEELSGLPVSVYLIDSGKVIEYV
ncbi:MAG: cobalt-precorrin-5B (C(1))-methyltransferase CbiD [Desulfobacteraceae bacterium]|nr:cobalt-precorrin-5B (C(1))-methyltransferase CbiD [Desulfobacteraceae bacterium]